MVEENTFDLRDAGVHAAILGFGLLQAVSYLRTTDFPNDATYFELARSIVNNHSYQLFSFRPETMLPPGFPFILALVVLVAGSKLSAFYHVIAIAATVGVAITYELLRRIEGRGMAAATALLIMSSPPLFEFATQLIFSDMPYFAVSMIALLLVWRLSRRPPSIGGMVTLGLVLGALILIRSTGLAMLLGLASWIGASCLFNTGNRRRVLFFSIPLVLGCATQLGWSVWASHRQFSEWPIHGYPGSYFSQLEVKSGNDPELGMANWRDVSARVKDNLAERAAQFATVITRIQGIEQKWCSPPIICTLLLISIGLIFSLIRGGGELHDWYFLFYEATFAFWPWEFEWRFLLPITPLAFLYMWRGGKVLTKFIIRRTQLAALSFLGVGTLFSLECIVWVIRERSAQAVAAIAFWIIVAALGVSLLGMELAERRRAQLVLGGRVIAAPVVCALTLIGWSMQLSIARANSSFKITNTRYYPDIEAAEWIQGHEPPQSVVMARKEDLVYHYSHHPVLWFPPISDPHILEAGIQKYHVRTLVVVDRQHEYFMPPQPTCFQRLFSLNPKEFHLVHHGPGDWIFEVNRAGSN